MEWKEVQIQDISSVLGDGLHGTPRYDENGKYYFINGNNLSSGTIVIKNDTKKVSTDEYLKYKKNLNERTLLVSINGTIGNVAKYSGEPCILGKSACYFNVIDSVDRDFIFYVISSPSFIRNLNNEATGTTIKNVSLKQMREYRFMIPTNIADQRRIASFLSALDDKIAINRRICENLEAQAQALFKHWFIDFAPFKNGQFVESELGMIPEGWRVYTLGEICKCELGGTPSRANKSYWGGNIAWINSGEVNKFRICEASEYITEEGLNHSATKLLPVKTTVLAITGATLGQVSLLEIDSCANQSVVGVKENSKIPYTFIYPAIKSKIKELVNMQTGGAQQHINKDNIQSLKIVLPPQKIMEEYKSISLHLYEEIGNLCFENLRLSTLRDTLLPKLMSGEIKV